MRRIHYQQKELTWLKVRLESHNFKKFFHKLMQIKLLSIFITLSITIINNKIITTRKIVPNLKKKKINHQFILKNF